MTLGFSGLDPVPASPRAVGARVVRFPGDFPGIARRFLLLGLLVIGAGLTGCASFSQFPEEPEVTLVDLKPLPSEGVEQRFEITLRILNPNDRDLAADGIDLILDLNGQRLGRGVSATPFHIPQLSDDTVKLVATTHLLDVVRQAFALSSTQGQLDYQLRGRIRLEGSIGWIRFSKEGSLLPESARRR